MVLAEIGTAGVISAYFFRHMTSGYSLNVSDPIKGQPVQLSDYLFVSGCGLVFWLLVMLRAKLHDSGGRQSDIRKVAKLAKLIAPITTLNLCGCLLAPFMKLPLLVRFLVLFQVSSNLALLLIWAFLSLKECMILPDTHTPQKSSPEVRVELSIPSNPIPHGRSSLPISKLRGHINRRILKKFFELFSNLQSSFSEGAEEGRGVTNAYVPITISGTNIQASSASNSRFNAIQASSASNRQCNPMQASSAYGFSRTISSGTNSKVNAICGKVDEAGGSGSGHGSGASGKEENRGRYGGNDGGGGAGGGGGGDRGESGSGHGSGASGSGENSGGYGGHGRDEWGTVSGHGSGAGGSGENRGGDEGHGQDEGGTGSGHGSGAGGSGENRGGDEGHGQDQRGTGGGHGSGAGGSGENRGGSEGDPECGVSGTNTKQASKSSSYSITEMSLMLTAQTTSTLIGFHVIPTPSSSSKSFLVVALMDQLVAYLCGLTSIMLKSSNKPEAAEIFEKIGFVCTALGFILMVAMFVQWEFVLIALLLFGVVWFYFFGNDLKTKVLSGFTSLGTI